MSRGPSTDQPVWAESPKHPEAARASEASHRVLKVSHLFIETGDRRVLVCLLLLAGQTRGLFVIAFSEQSRDLKFAALAVSNRVLALCGRRPAQAEQGNQSSPAGK